MAEGSLKHAASLVPVGAFSGKPAMPLTRNVLVIGSGKHSRVLLKSDSVSTTHTLLIHTDAGWYFRDLVSRTHTILNGRSQREASVRNGDTLTIGAFAFHFVSIGHADPGPAPAAAAMEITGAEIPVPIDTRTVLIGRRVGCEVRLIEESVSLVHAVIFEADGVRYVRDLYSRTGTYLNGKKIHQEPLKFGDIILVGETTIEYVPDRSTAFDPPSDVASDATSDVSDDVAVPLAASIDEQAKPAPIGIRAGLTPGLASLLTEPRAPASDEAPALNESPASMPPGTPQPPRPDAPSAHELALVDDAPVLPLGRRQAFDDRPAIEALAAIDEHEAIDAEPAVANRPLAATPTEVEAELLAEVEPLAEAEPLAEVEPLLDVELIAEVTSVEASRSPRPREVGLPVPPPIAPADVADDIESEVLGLGRADEPSMPTLDLASLHVASLDAASPVDSVVDEAGREKVTLDRLETIEAVEVIDPVEPIDPVEVIDPVAATDPLAAPTGDATLAVPLEAVATYEPVELVATDSTIDEPIEEQAVGEQPADEQAVEAAAGGESLHEEPFVAKPSFVSESSFVADEPFVAEPSPSEPAAAAVDTVEPIAPLSWSAEPSVEPIAEVAVPAPAVIIPQDMSELAQLQLRIREALTDPSTLLSRPLPADSNPSAPAAPFEMSASARRARAIAQLLEGHEEIEEEAERESALIPFESPDVEAAAPPIPQIAEPPLIDVVQADANLEATDDAIVEAPPEAGGIADEVADKLGEKLTVAASLAESLPAETIEVGEAGRPIEPASAAVEVESLSLASGESAVAGDEADAAIDSPTLDDVTAEPLGEVHALNNVEAAAEPVDVEPIAESIASHEETASEGAADAPTLDDASVADIAAGVTTTADRTEAPVRETEVLTDVTPSAETSAELTFEPTVEPAAERAAEVVPTPTGQKGRRGRKSTTPATPVRIPPTTTPLVPPAASPKSRGVRPRRGGKFVSAAEAALAAATPNLEPENQPTIDAGAAAIPAIETTIDAAPTVVNVTPAAGDVAVSTDAFASAPIDSRDTVAANETFPTTESPAAAADLVEPATIAGMSEEAVEADLVDADAGSDRAAALAAALSASLAEARSVTADAAPHLATPHAISADVDVLGAGGPTTLDAIAHAHQPEPLAIEEVIVPTQLAQEPDELGVVQAEEQGPIELDEPHAGEFIATQPRTIDTVAVEEVSPMFDPDPGTIAERDAIDGVDEPEQIDEEPSARHAGVVESSVDAPVIVMDADDELVTLEQQTRPLIAVDEPLVDEEEEPTLAADAPLDAPLEALLEAIAPITILPGPTADADAPLHVTEVVALAADDAHLLVVDAATAEADDLSSLIDDGSPIEGDAPGVEGASLAIEAAHIDEAPAAASVALTDALADAEVLSTGASADVPREMEVLVASTEALAAQPLLVDEPAPIDGSTLASVSSLPIDTTEPEVVEERPALRIAGGWDDETDDETDDEAAVEVDAGPEAPAHAVPSIEQELAAPPRAPVPSGAISVRSSNPTSVLNVKVPTLDELEASFQDAFADALAMADGASFATPTAPAPQVVKPVAQHVPAPKWELDESLLDQAEANASQGSSGNASGGMSGGMGGSAAFMSLGGIGWIGDDAADEYESLPGSAAATHFPAGPQPMRGGLVPRRESRRRRPVPTNDASPAHDSPAIDIVEPILDLPMELTADGSALELDLSELPPMAGDEDPTGVSTLSDVPATFGDDSLVLTLNEETGLADDDEVRPLNDIHRNGDGSQDPSGEGVQTLPAPTPQATPLTLPPRPLRRPRAPGNGLSRADADESLGAGVSASPFAEQALPLVDAFSHGPQAGLDEMLAKLGVADGHVVDHPPITQDVPAGGNRGVAAPFASHVPIPSDARHASEKIQTPGVRRVRQQLNKLPLLLALMLMLMGVAALGAWYWPVPVTVRAEVAFTNLNKLDTIDRHLLQGQIKLKLAGLDRAARNNLDDRYGGGFLDRPELYASVLEAARFDAYNPNLLFIEYRSSVNQVESDKVRLNALVKAFVAANRDLVDAKRKLDDEVARLERARTTGGEQIAQLEREQKTNKAIYDGSPSGDELRKLERDLAQLEAARKAAVQALDQREAELKRIEADPVSLAPASEFQTFEIDLMAMLADLGGGLPATPATQPAKDWNAELNRLIADRDAAKARLGQLLQTQTPAARQAREGFDASMTAFAAEVDAARKALGDRPEVMQYVESARKLQEQIRNMTDTLVRRQQQQLTRLDEFKRQLRELTESTRDERMNKDPQLKEWGDRLAFAERQLNASKEANAPQQDVATIEAELSLLKNMIAGKRETLNDPKASNVTKQLEEMMQVAGREMAADRADNEQLLADVQETFRRQQPAVEKLPDDQKQLSETLASRLAQIDLARQRYTDSLAVSAGGDALKISELQARVANADESIAEAQTRADADAVAQAAEMERRMKVAAAIDAARKAVAAAQATRDEAVANYEAKRQAVESVRDRVAQGTRAGQRNDEIEAQIARLRSENGNLIAAKNRLAERLDNATVVPPQKPADAYALGGDRSDPRLTYGAAGMGAVLIGFAPLLLRETRNRSLAAAASNTKRASIPTAEPIPSGAHTA